MCEILSMEDILREGERKREDRERVELRGAENG